MATSKRKQLTKVNALSSSLDELEKILDPLFQQSLPEFVAPLETLQQASLHVLLPYLVNDLVFIYLKTRGIDPKTHPVVAELDRVRQYFSKIKDAENSDKKRTTEIDKAAATRFIKHAIAQAQTEPSIPKESVQPIASSSTEAIPVRVTDKMRERDEYLKRVRDTEEESDDDGLDIIDDAEDEAHSDENGKGKAVAKDTEGSISSATQQTQTQTSKKKRKSAMDPFGSFGEDQTQEGRPGPANKRVAVISGNDTPSSSRASSDTETSKTPRRRKRKKKPTGETKDTSD